MEFIKQFCFSFFILLSTSLSAQQNCNSFKADFTFAPDTAAVQNGMGTVKFTNTSTYFDSSNVSYRWQYGVGSFSNDSNKTHSQTYFFIPATFNVCLKATRIKNGDTCQDSTCKSVYVENCFIRADYTITKDTSCFIYTFTSAKPANTYDWSFGDGTNSNLKSVKHVFASTGEHNVCLLVTDTLKSGIVCRDVSCRIVTICKGLSTTLPINLIQATAYPNPIKSILNIETPSTNLLKFTITDLLGRAVKSGFFSEKIAVDLSALNNGFYYLELIDDQKVVFRQKISK